MVNKVMLIGYVGKDPEVRRLETGTTIAKFSLATNENYKNRDGEKMTSTEWHKIVAWKGWAEWAEKYVKKGQLLQIDGRIEYYEYEGHNGKVKDMQIVASKIQIIN